MGKGTLGLAWEVSRFWVCVSVCLWLWKEGFWWPWSSGQKEGGEGKRGAFGFWNCASLGSESLFGVSLFVNWGKEPFSLLGSIPCVSGIGYSRIGHEICLYYGSAFQPKTKTGKPSGIGPEKIEKNWIDQILDRTGPVWSSFSFGFCHKNIGSNQTKLVLYFCIFLIF